MRLTKLRQQGDTIVEVIISIGVASSVLGITFATMNRNLLLTRVAEERTEATKQIQGQIESLIAVKNAGTPDLPVFPTNFCMNGQAIQKLDEIEAGAPVAQLDADVFTIARYPNFCTNGLFHLAIVPAAAPPNSSILYTFYIRWDRVDGKGRDEIKMVFRK